MFIGHFAAGIAFKGVDRQVPLWALLVAVQLVDIATMIFVLIGIERLDIVPGFTKYNDFDMFMPFTHSLVMTPVWAAIGAALYWLYDCQASRAALLTIAGAVACHWFLDLIVHVPDLPILLSEDWKVGFGLWNMPLVTVLIEASMLTLALLIYRRSRDPRFAINRIILGAICVIFYLFVIQPFIMPLPMANTQEAAITGLAAFLIVPLMGYFAERRLR